MTSSFVESDEKTLVREALRKAGLALGRQELTYLGMPEAAALDIRILQRLLRNVICIDWERKKLEVAEHNISDLPLKVREFHACDVWEYLKSDYYRAGLTADMTFLDFLGGGISSADTFAHEMHALRSYFSRQALHPRTAFVFAWTYMPHDRGLQAYTRAVENSATEEEKKMLRGLTGIRFRSLAIRLVLSRLLQEHNMTGKIYFHALYKTVMSSLILVFSKGHDPKCTLPMGSPESILSEPIRAYKKGQVVPDSINITGT
jgi:hypothetical protein